MKIAQGAEAIIREKDNIIIKERFRKTYRIEELDQKLRKKRTKREARFMEKLPIPGPKFISMDDKNMILEMKYIKGDIVKNILEKKDYKKICREIGKKIAILHNQGMIHADLTTSNMILKDEIYLIDFGLSFFSEKTEDKAVDLHLLKQALESKHYSIWEECFQNVLKGYKKADKYKEIIKRLDKVEMRGRYKHKAKNN